MNRVTGTTMKPIMLASAFRLDSGNSMPYMSSWPYSAALMYFQLGHVRTYTDFCVWCNNYGILATNVDPVMRHTVASLQPETTDLNALPKL